MAPKASSKDFPREKINLTPHQEKAAAHAEQINDLVPFEDIVLLEVTDESVIGEIGDLVLLEDSWFVLDRIEETVVQFDKTGSFIRQIGRKGQGPGEYGAAHRVERCFDNNLAIFDSIQGKIHVYSPDGAHILSTPSPGKTMIAFSSFIWDEKNALFLGDFSSQVATAPWHAKIAYPDFDLGEAVGFGSRPPLLRWLKLKFDYGIFKKQDGIIWSGSPYESQIEFYNEQGQHLGTTAKGRGNRLQLEDFARGKVKDRSEVYRLFGKARNCDINFAGDLVFVDLGSAYDIYDRNGNLLKGSVRSKMPPFLDGFGQFLACAYSTDGDPKYIKPEIRVALEAKGWRAEQKDHNPMIWVGRLVE